MWPIELIACAELCGAEIVAGMSVSEGTRVEGLVTDSRQVAQGLVYVPLKGERFDGHAFLEEVLSKSGVLAIVPRSMWPELRERNRKCAALLVEDALQAFQTLARVAFTLIQRFGSTLKLNLQCATRRKLFGGEKSSIGNPNLWDLIPVSCRSGGDK